MLTELQFDRLIHAWDEVDTAAKRVETALPEQMTEAAGNLTKARMAMGRLITMINHEIVRDGRHG